MKKVLLIVLLLIVISSCTEDYEKTEIKTTEGVTIKVDSTKFTPAMVYIDEENDCIYVAQEGKINKIIIYSPRVIILCTLVFFLIVVIFIIIFNEK